jgi:hypothetical protein
MNAQPMKSALALGVCVVIGLAVLGFLIGNAALKVKSLERTVVVKGLSEREAPADIAIWPTTFQDASNELDALFESIQTKNTLVIDFLIDHGLTRDEITVTPPAVVDLYAQNYGNKEHITYRYTGRSTITVYSSKVDAVREAMSDVIDLGKEGVALSGQNYQSQTQFLFTGLNDLKPAMIEEATKNARTVAEKFAADSQSKLGKIKSARQGQFSIQNRDATTAHIKKIRVVSTVVYYLSD